MKEETKIKLRKARRLSAKIKSKYERGRAQFGFLIDLFQVSVVAAIGIEWWNRNTDIHIDPKYLLPAMGFLIIFFTIWGHLDQTKLHFQQEENEYAASLSPLGKIEKMVRDIKDKLFK